MKRGKSPLPSSKLLSLTVLGNDGMTRRVSYINACDDVIEDNIYRYYEYFQKAQIENDFEEKHTQSYIAVRSHFGSSI